MTNIVNLNKARKAKLKQEKKREAGHNRVVHGLSVAARKLEKARQAREEERLDAHILKTRQEMKRD